jgi:chemotaxis protein MotB
MAPKAVNRESPMTLRSHEFFLVGDPLPKRDEWDPKPPTRASTAWIVAAVATCISVVAVVIFAVERTSYAEEIGKREVRIAELEAMTATQGDKLTALERDKAQTIADAALKEAEAKARAKAIIDTVTTSLGPEVARGDAKVETLADGKVRIELSDRLLFAENPALVSDGGREALVRLGAVLAGLGDRSIDVVGHTDNRKPKDWQDRSFWELASVRASAVVLVLEQEAKVPAKKLVAAGKGATEPKQGNGSTRGRQKNRRVEIVIHP